MDITTLDALPVTAPGLYRGIAAIDYHADRICPTPALSRSIAQTLLERSPWHAWFAHPRLNPAYQPEESRRLDVGTLAHALLIGRGRDIIEIHAPDYRTKAAQQARDDARLAGKTPALEFDLFTARAMVTAARQQLAAIPECECLFDPGYGEGEVVAVWQDEAYGGEDGVWCRAQIDWLPRAEGRPHFVDYKTTGVSANPAELGRLIASQAYELQFAFYERAFVALNPALDGYVDALFVFQETAPPYALSVIALDEEAKIVGRKKADVAIAGWARCLTADEWPGYPSSIQVIQFPSWALSRWLDREAIDEMKARGGPGYDPYSLLRQPGAPGGARLE